MYLVQPLSGVMLGSLWQLLQQVRAGSDPPEKQI